MVTYAPIQNQLIKELFQKIADFIEIIRSNKRDPRVEEILQSYRDQYPYEKLAT